jgi:hypothetical protein
MPLTQCPLPLVLLLLVLVLLLVGTRQPFQRFWGVPFAPSSLSRACVLSALAYLLHA